ncbi:glycosyltransferase family 4 protein [Conexibacter sp. SYSU D00693]|uniref:glycosyltransferase family 4 protein n=1 Tax=Conexibacter sp. SYSU D00693 TaxID=2812560 RepID=UPI00196A42D2|nr:glycosyltransferase family 4 protein [Conexibacter sp. SYSU D00693]
MFPPHHQGGYEVVWRSFVRHARAAGHQVTVLTTDHREPGVEDGEDVDVHRDLRWYWADHAFPRRSVRERVALERHNARVLDRHLDRGPGAVMWWAMGGMSLSLVGRAARRGLAAVGVVHDPWPAYAPQVDGWQGSRAGRLLGPLLGMPASFAPAVVDAWSCNSAYTRWAVLQQPGWAGLGDRVQVDHPGIDPARLPPSAPRDAFGWRLACIGRVEERKGLAHAIEALARLPERATLTVVGGGDHAHRAELEALAARLGLGARVRFTGPVDDVGTAYAAADAVVFPVTWQEPFGLVPLEAMAVGRPVVSTATGGAAEYLEDGGNALVVAPGDPEAIAAAVRRLAEDPTLRVALVARGRATATRFTQAALDEALLALVSRVGGRPAGAGR